ELHGDVAQALEALDLGAHQHAPTLYRAGPCGHALSGNGGGPSFEASRRAQHSVAAERPALDRLLAPRPAILSRPAPIPSPPAPILSSGLGLDPRGTLGVLSHLR